MTKNTAKWQTKFLQSFAEPQNNATAADAAQQVMPSSSSSCWHTPAHTQTHTHLHIYIYRVSTFDGNSRCLVSLSAGNGVFWLHFVAGVGAFRMLPLKTLGHKSHEMRMRIEGRETGRKTDDGRREGVAVSKSVGSQSA